jgi:N-acetylmuramoyl-L-alanine amidase
MDRGVTSHAFDSPQPDTPLAIKVVASPNHGERKDGKRPSILVLHYTGMQDPAVGALNWLCNPLSQVSCHYLVFEDGRIFQLVPEARRAWHAGAGSWQGEMDVNSASIGIEIANPGHDYGYRPFPEPQIAAVSRLAREIAERWAIAPDRVIAHSDMAPERKRDPGELFPWDRLHAAGVGHWVPPVPISGGRFLAEGDSGQPVAALQAMLALYGYPVPVEGVFDAATTATVTAFQRHFRPERVDGVADLSTITTLRNLIASRPVRPDPPLTA